MFKLSTDNMFVSPCAVYTTCTIRKNVKTVDLSLHCSFRDISHILVDDVAFQGRRRNIMDFGNSHEMSVTIVKDRTL